MSNSHIRAAVVLALAGLAIAASGACALAQPGGGGGGGGSRSGEGRPAAAAEKSEPKGEKGEKADKSDKKDGPKSATIERSVTIGGAVVKYRVTSGMMPLMDDRQKTKASVFYTAYERLPDDAVLAAKGRSGAGEGGSAVEANGASRPLGASAPGARPITFAFNGGPGSSSVWLHLGALGPRRIKMGDSEGMAPEPPGVLIDNDQAWLDFTDLVFIDPVSTGYSRAADGEDAKQFHGVEEDVRWMGEFIRLYLVRSQRWASPKFLAGESYGTTRAAGLSSYLQGQLGVSLNGIVLISPVLNFQTLSFDVGNDTPYPLFLPTYTATAFHHGKLGAGATLEAAVSAARTFAMGEYWAALNKGDGLGKEERERIAARLSELTGLSKEFVLRSDLRVTIGAFTKELLRDKARTVGRLDSRYLGIDRDSAGERTEYDPSYAAIQGPYTAALNDYVRREVGFESDVNYEILTGNVRPWNYAPNTNRYVNVGESLRSAMSQNPSLRVLVCSGYFDLACPALAMEHTITHLQLDPALRGNIRQEYYKAGHMMYVREEDLRKLRTDTKAFYAGGR